MIPFPATFIDISSTNAFLDGIPDKAGIPGHSAGSDKPVNPAFFPESISGKQLPEYAGNLSLGRAHV